MKTLRIKKVNIAICWNNLKNTPPSEFPSIGEMEKTSDILELFKDSIPEYIKILREGEELNSALRSGKFPPEEAMKKKAEYDKSSMALESESGNEEMELEFEDETFNVFFQQFERWGKNWFQKLEPFLAFRKSLIATNGQSKDKEGK